MEDQMYRDHKMRGLILDYISKNPGASFVTLKNVFRMSESTLRYHLDYMQKKRRISLEKKGGKRCYYPYIRKVNPYVNCKADLNEEQSRMLDVISIHPGISIGELKERSGMKNGTFSYNLKRLKELRLVWRRPGQNGFGYEVVTKERIADEVFLVLLDKYLEGELGKAELEDFFEKLDVYRNKE